MEIDMTFGPVLSATKRALIQKSCKPAKPGSVFRARRRRTAADYYHRVVYLRIFFLLKIHTLYYVYIMYGSFNRVAASTDPVTLIVYETSERMKK